MIASPTSRRTLAFFAVVTAALVSAATLLWWRGQALQEAAFHRDDAAALPEDETGLRHAYEYLRQGGYRVALQTPEQAAPPPRELAWWIFQSGPEWFRDPEGRAQQIRHFVEVGGTVVLAPLESVTRIPDIDEDPQTPDELTARVDRFFSALGLELRLLAFEAPADDAEGVEVIDEIDDAPTSEPVEGSGYPLVVTGNGEHFEPLSEVETSWGNYFEGESLLKGEIRLNSDGFPLLVEFKMGKGRLVLIAESTYFENEFLDRPANKALLEALAKAYGGGGIELFAAR